MGAWGYGCTIGPMSEETSFSGKVPYKLTKEDAEKLWTGDPDEVGKFAASFINAGMPGSEAEAAEVRVLALLQVRTAHELAKATYHLAFYTKALIFVAALQAVAIILAAFIAR